MAQSKMGQQSDEGLEKLRRRLAKKLVGFTKVPPSDEMPAEVESYHPEPSKFPVPELVLFMLRHVLGWHWHGRDEKVRWTVHGWIDGDRIAFALQKFGFTIFLPKGRTELPARVEGQLRQALREVEEYLRPLAESQASRGEVTIVNRISEFEDRYHFFRELADTAFRRANDAPPREMNEASDITSVDTERMRLINWRLDTNREGFFHSTAMVDSYFSYLEHRLVLLRAFTGRPFADNELLALLSMRWEDKLKLILQQPLPALAGDILGQMRRIKERIRNPFAHGGFENDRGSLFFRLPRIGAIPANFTRFGDSVRFSVLPVDAAGHAESCATFDALDALLEADDLVGPNQFVRRSVDPTFDASSVCEYASAIADGPEAIDAYIKAWWRGWELHANMDY